MHGRAPEGLKIACNSAACPQHGHKPWHHAVSHDIMFPSHQGLSRSLQASTDMPYDIMLTACTHETVRPELQLCCQEVVLQLALMADATHEVLKVTRFLDDENMPIEDLSWEVHQFLSSLQHLFDERQAFKAETFTKHMMTALSKPRILRLRAGDVKSLGAPSQDIMLHASLRSPPSE